MKIKNILLFFGLILLLSVQINANPVVWVGGIGVWEDDNNWSTGQVPAYDEGVIISSGKAIVENYAQVAYIHLDGGDLEVAATGMLFMYVETAWYPPSNSIRGIVIENGSRFDNRGYTYLLEPSNMNGDPTMIFCDGEFINHAYAVLFCQGDNSTGLHSYVNSGTIINNGEITMPFIKNGMYLIGSFINNNKLDIGCTGYAIKNRAQFEGASVSYIYINGRIETNPGSNWIHRGVMDMNFTSSTNSSVFHNGGTLDIQTDGTININGSHKAFTVNSTGTLRVRGELNIDNTKSWDYAISNAGFLVNHQNGEVNTSAHYGIYNSSSGEVRNFGIWRANESSNTNYCTIWNSGIFSNRPKGKLYVEGRLNLKANSTFNNQGHMFALDDNDHADISGQFNNTGTLNDVYDKMSTINNNTSYRVHSIPDVLVQGVPIANILDKGSNPGATVLSWHTTSGGNVSAGTYNASTNTFTPNANGAGLSSVWVRTRINTGGHTRRHELKTGSPVPLVQPNDELEVASNLEVELFPNPIEQNFKIDVRGQSATSTFNYSIYSSMGQLVSSGTFNQTNNSLEIDPFLPGGMYFVKVTDPEGTFVETKQIRVVR